MSYFVKIIDLFRCYQSLAKYLKGIFTFPYIVFWKKTTIGFRVSHSTNHGQIGTTKQIKSKMNTNNYEAGMFIDIQKAFGTVVHEVLWDKDAYYEFGEKCQQLKRAF